MPTKPICKFCDNFMIETRSCDKSDCMFSENVTNKFSNAAVKAKNDYILKLESKLRFYKNEYMKSRKKEKVDIPKEHIYKMKLFECDPVKYKKYAWAYNSCIDKIKERERQTGHVYVIMAGEYYKIGIAKDLSSRVRSHQTSNAHEVLVVKSKELFNYNHHEKVLHDMFNDKKVRGEWFSLNESDLVEIQKYFDKQEKPKKIKGINNKMIAVNHHDIKVEKNQRMPYNKRKSSVDDFGFEI